MTAPHNGLYLIAMVLAAMGWGASVVAEEDVTVVSAPAATTAPTQKTVAPDGTPVVHKSLHKKKTPLIAAANTASDKGDPASSAAPSAPASAANPAAFVPAVETGLPVARYPGMGAPIKGVSTYMPTPVSLSAAKSVPGTTTRQTYFASAFPSAAVPVISSAAGSFSSPGQTTGPSPDFVSTTYSRKARVTYPWKTGIITTMFWIGEGSTPISSTTNVQSSWDEDWMPKNRGSDSPYNRNGYASGSHASTLNPFYVALPFNDLAFPDKAREWVPRSWHRGPKDGKQVSACKDRWVEIKNEQGRSCYAQWEDVGPLRYDHAEYVFGGERPIGLGGNHAGLDVSPAVAQYLDVDGRNRITSWRFVEDEDVRPGPWLLLDEQAVLFTALHQLKTFRSSPDLPIQRATEPIDDNIDSNKKKVDASKG